MRGRFKSTEANPGRGSIVRQNLLAFEAQLDSGTLPPAISLAVASNLLSEFLHGPVNNKLRLRIRLFRFLFDWFSHDKSLPRTYTELLALFANECGGSRTSYSHGAVVESHEHEILSAPNVP
jgi:hypothetical protein